MAGRPLATIVALAVAVVSLVWVSEANRPQEAATCASDNGLACRGGARDVSLVQVHQQRGRIQMGLSRRAAAGEKEGQAAAAKVAASIRSYLAVPANVGAGLAAGVMAVQSTLPLFTADKIQLAAGFSTLGSKLFDAVSMIMPEKSKQSNEYEDLEAAWEEIVETLPTLENLATGIRAFKEDGDTPAFLGVCTMVIKELAALVSSALPEDVSAEVVKYLVALEDAVDGFDEAMEAFAGGSTTAAVESMYSGIRLAASGLLPPEGQDSQAYTEVVGALDIVFQSLSEAVLKYRQQLLQSQVCWKQLVGRDRKRPDQCPRHLKFDGKQWCRKDADMALLESSVARKKPSDAAAPHCADDSDFSEQKGSWCYKNCPYGTTPAGKRCKSICTGDFPIDSRLMCGKSPGTVDAAIAEMTVSTIRGLVGAGASGFAGNLTGTIRSLVKLGKGFAYPKCPVMTR